MGPLGLLLRRRAGESGTVPPVVIGVFTRRRVEVTNRSQQAVGLLVSEGGGYVIRTVQPGRSLVAPAADLDLAQLEQLRRLGLVRVS